MSDDRNTTDFATGAQRSANGEHLDFTSLPLIGLIGAARTAAEGGTKYGRFNYLQGMPAHGCVNRAIRHLVMWSLGDRSEPHLEHAAWNCMAASQSAQLHPELNAPHNPGPGFSVTPEILAELEAGKVDRRRRREAGEFDRLDQWQLSEVPEVARILEQRKQAGP